MQIGNIIYEYRTKRGLSQRNLASKSGVSNATISRIEKGLVIPDTDTLSKIASVLNLDINYLLGRSDSPTPKGMSLEKKEAFFKGLDELQLEKYKNLSPEDKELLAAQFNALIDRLEKGKK